MKKLLIPFAVASILAAGSSHAEIIQQDIATDDNNDVTVISIGAVSGAIIAGPAGFIVGGIVGALIVDDSKPETDEIVQLDESINNEVDENMSSIESDVFADYMMAEDVMNSPVVETEISNEVNNIEEIVSNDLSMDVYFKAGSIDVERFYSHQLSVLTSLMREMPELKLNLDGYSDRRGDANDNFRLSIARLESVREYFVKQGIDDSRININAYGEKNFISTAGDLDAYVFDRRVEVSFISNPTDSQNSVASTGDASSL